MRKKYGNTWWGKQWLNALANIDYSNRLPRGRTYANKGLAQDILLHKNKISAKVQGSRATPYKVQFTIPDFSASAKAKIIEIVSSNPLYLSKLLNRELPTELMESCRQKGIALFPDSWKDLEGNCSCPDWAVPCKHMAAVLYLVANEIDKNPFLVFELHDFDLFKGLEGIGYTVQGQKEIHISTIEELSQSYGVSKEIVVWEEDVFLQLDFSHIPDCRADLLAILSPHPVFYPHGDFKKILQLAYSGVAKSLAKKAIPFSEESKQIPLENIEAIEILLDEEADFLNVTFRNYKGKIIDTFDEQSILFDFLQKIPLSDFKKYSPALKSLILLLQFAKKLLLQSAVIPQLIRVGTKHYKIRWLPAILNPTVRSLFAGIRSICQSDILFYKKGKAIFEPIDSDKIPALISLFLNYLINENHKLNYRYAEHEIGHLFFNGAILSFQTYETKEFPNHIQLWLNRFFMVEKKVVPLVQVEEEEDKGFRVNIAAQKKGKGISTPIPLKEVLGKKKHQNIRMPFLRDLAMLSEYFPQINDLVASNGAKELFFDGDQFVEVLFKIIPMIRLFGVKVLLPKTLRKLMRPRMSIALESKEESGVVSTPSLVNMAELMQFEWQVSLGDQMLSEEEFIKMVEKYSGIVKLNDQYIFFDEKEIQTLIERMKNPPKLKPNQLLHTALTEDYEGAKVHLDQATKKLIKQLLEGEKVKVPKGLKATLRPYQLSGYKWLYKNSKIGFGSLIADDMGLGKTLQVITTLLKLKEEGVLGPQKAIIIVPTTLLTNWEKEILKFAPALSTMIYHGNQRKLDQLSEVDILLTTYGVARTDASILQKKKWLLLAIDEAQNIKNPGTAQTKAIKKIKAPIKIAMSGTPVENRLSEYWSIFDFTNAGYLNTLAKFKKDFAKPIEADRDQTKLEQFRKITSPFILRRLKSDKSIIKDLPDKIEKDQFCELTGEQAAIYQNVIETTMQAIDGAEGITRKGLVLKLITALKQVCNHPKHFLKKGKADPQLSGKTKMLFELLQEIQNSHGKTLIFTQYQEMGKMLVAMLESAFGLEIAFLHGGVTRKDRDLMVEDFQNNRATRILILSLKAGGTGLNLTAANNVIHYDLWWNPAVEAQATDRAYRIGQKNNVMVHRLITQGSFEEKINELLLQKKELANLAVSTGEQWIGDLSNEALRDLVKLD